MGGFFYLHCTVHPEHKQNDSRNKGTAPGGGGGGSLADKICATHPRSNTLEMDPKWRIAVPYGTSNLHP